MNKWEIVKVIVDSQNQPPGPERSLTITLKDGTTYPSVLCSSTHIAFPGPTSFQFYDLTAGGRGAFFTVSADEIKSAMLN